MKLLGIVQYLLYFVFLTCAKTSGRRYRPVTCLSMLKVTSGMSRSTLSDCAILCDMENGEAFSFNNHTDKCEVFVGDTEAWPGCRLPTDVRYFVLHGACQSLPVPPGYGLEYPYYSSRVRAKYRCTTTTDQSPVDHCPVVSCDGQQNFTVPPISCSVKDLFNRSLTGYEGGVTCTARGVTCQRWDTNYPHETKYYVGRSDLGNRCQLRSSHRPWCYTMDPEMRWDYCAVQDVDCGAPPTILAPPNMTEDGIHTEWPYRGSRALAWYRCASLTTSDPVSSCPVSRCDENLMWSNANLSCSVKDCYDVTNQTYHGRVSCTELGITCQRWDSDYPHSHTILEGRSDLDNWCQLEEESRPWCYTTNPDVTWEYCQVEQCH